MKQIHRQRPNFPHLCTCLCGKVYATTKDEARRLKHEIEDLAGYSNPVRYYQCAHGSWHWTSHVDRRTA